MGYLTDISKEKIEKIGLVVVRPRVRHTGWSLVNPGIYQTTFELGVPTTCYELYDANSPEPMERVADVLSVVSAGKFHYDSETKVLTIFATLGDPDTQDYPGITVEFEVHLATRPIYGRRDPLDGTFPDVVEWEPAIKQAPSATNGSQNDIFGFIPVNIASIEVANDGWMNELLYEASWYLAPVKAYMLVGSDYETAVQSSGVVQTFSGFVAGISESNKVVSISISDYTKKLDQQIPVRHFSNVFPNIEPSAILPEGPLAIPKIYGLVDLMEPVNLDYADTPSATTANNRKWATHDTEGRTLGDYTLTIDHTQPNTFLRTYFTTVPGLNVGDQIVLNHASGTRYVTVSAVDRTLKYVDHSFAGPRTVVAGETVTRPFVARVDILDRDGNLRAITPDYYTTFNDGTNKVAGFTLANNFEASFAFVHTPFDPNLDKIYARVYGTKDLPSYEDATPVGGLSRASGVASDGVSVLAYLLQAASLLSDQWDKTTFSAVGADSNAMGLMIPTERGGQPSSFKEVISQLLISQLWKLGFVTDAGGEIKIGLVAIQPFPAPFDYAVDKTELFDFEWEQDYGDIYSDLTARYKVLHSSPTRSFVGSGTVSKESAVAKNLHLIDRTYEVELLQSDPDEADTAAARLMFILGERRGIYKLKLPYTQLLNAKVGAAYQVTRDHLPGFAYAFDAENARTLNLIEVQKDLSSVSLVLEDQKGVQDNAGDW